MEQISCNHWWDIKASRIRSYSSKEEAKDIDITDKIAIVDDNPVCEAADTEVGPDPTTTEPVAVEATETIVGEGGEPLAPFIAMALEDKVAKPTDPGVERNTE